MAGSQRVLGERTGDLAGQRSRDETAGGRRPAPGAQAGTLPFQATERAQAVAREQEALEQRVQELSKAVEEIARAAQAAGIDGSAFQARLREVQQLLQRAVTPELEQRLRELQEALAKLDPDATRQALQRLAEAQQQLKAELERSRELFQRAASEGALASLAADAEELKRRQAEWNATDARRPDSAAAARERALEERTDSLAHGIEQVGKDLGSPSGREASLAAPQQAARQAQAAMQRAAGSAGQGDQAGAQRSGEAAEQQLAAVPEALRARRDSLAGAWRQETLGALDRALSETAGLADREQQVAEALRRGDGGPATRSRQASIEEGTTAVERQIREAAGEHALVSPQLEGALGLAERQMAAAREQRGAGGRKRRGSWRAGSRGAASTTRRSSARSGCTAGCSTPAGLSRGASPTKAKSAPVAPPPATACISRPCSNPVRRAQVLGCAIRRGKSCRDSRPSSDASCSSISGD